MKTRSNTYYSTVVNDSAGAATIAELRNEVKIFNLQQNVKSLKNPTYVRKVQKVSLFGRLGKNNPNAWIYQALAAKQRACNWYGASAYQRISMKHATTVDIYVNIHNH